MNRILINLKLDSFFYIKFTQKKTSINVEVLSFIEFLYQIAQG